ncbi:ABC transporter permease [candidate division KSB1 bacterium]|nr:ABC transporter permease [candidate division KSB1 bacterium]
MGAVYVIWLRELKRFLRAKSRVIGSLGMPFFFLAILGIGLDRSFRIPGLQDNYIAFVAPGIIGMVLLFSSVISGISVIWDRKFGFLKEMLVAPISRTSIVAGKTLGGTTTAVIQALLMLGVALIVGAKVHSIIGLFISVLFMIIIAASFVGVGLAFASRMEDPHGFQLIINFIIMPIFFLSGAFFPLDNLPQWLKVISLLNPLTYGVDGLRGSLIGLSAFPLIMDFVLLLGFFALMTGVSTYLFARSEA